ncbi:hypothetical protein PA25_01280 [Pseudoalteromonas sp. A25]|uniref:TIGR02444 family protein n=1 Tax=Pseudoalteromonas sp. A25 TaxID=116092 RepID=UPI001260C06D|nr:TIGR02444 family protein [Pseudoalteromonas sp. A25]BBN80143.1 hypothetical protein PA25_01280 [Pseudoalteromonas sp. A25]
MSTLDEQAFWQFSCAVYQQGSVQHTLLTLQNEQHKNINLCLLLYYLDTLNLQLSHTTFVHLDALCQSLDAHLLAPHRKIRRSLKAQFITHSEYSEIRQQLLQSELQLEKLQQSELIRALNQGATTLKNPSNNLALYLNESQLQQLKMSFTTAKS